MASTSTSELQSVTGYIHNVSSLKQGPQKKFFDAQLQQKDTFCTLRIFRPELHGQFKASENER